LQQYGADEDLHADLVVVFGFDVGVDRSWFDASTGSAQARD
jgi:hypothetical protein